MEKDYSLLRPFDLEAAKAGEPICTDRGTTRYFVAEAGPDGDHAVRTENGNIAFGRGIFLRMAPLAWVEGKPVYKGDVLYRPRIDTKMYIADKIVRHDNGNVFLRYADGNGSSLIDERTDATWIKPKVKREEAEMRASVFRPLPVVARVELEE